MMNRGYHFQLALLFLLVLLWGCSQSGPQVAPVHGKVTLDGKPLPLADISFQPEGGQRASNGRTDSEGHYELAYKRGQSGALVGMHTVRVFVSQEGTKNAPIISPEFDRDSKLHRQVKVGDNEFDFNVTAEKK
jgi:hypothetical protein